MFTEWLKLNEHIWLFWQLNTEIVLGVVGVILSVVILKHEKESAQWLKREFEYDAAKDEAKRQKKTKTTRKTTEEAGKTITEEVTEINEGTANENTVRSD